MMLLKSLVPLTHCRNSFRGLWCYQEVDPDPMRRAVAFCQNIAVSKKITATYNTATEAYLGSLPADKKNKWFVASRH